MVSLRSVSSLSAPLAHIRDRCWRFLVPRGWPRDSLISEFARPPLAFYDATGKYRLDTRKSRIHLRSQRMGPDHSSLWEKSLLPGRGWGESWEGAAMVTSLQGPGSFETVSESRLWAQGVPSQGNWEWQASVLILEGEKVQKSL